jgi:hypothetical protein
MKPIDQMTLSECLEALRELDPYSNMPPICIAIADRIHDLTRWIPVSERMPTEADVDENGEVLVFETENESPHRKYSYTKRWNRFGEPDHFYTITHWKRITPPETT